MNQFNKTMKYMIDNHIIHRDIKPLNLLLHGKLISLSLEN